MSARDSPRFDDLTLVKLTGRRFPRLDLYRFSIGVGGGNGLYLVYSKTRAEEYQLVADTFDGDLNFCDKSVWIH